MGRLALIGIVFPAVALLYKDGPPVAHTGAFGEPSCYICHFEGPLNSSDAAAKLLNAPVAYVADSTYRLTARVEREGLGAGGFSLSGRFRDGRQAGTFRSVDDRVVVRHDTTSDIQYVMHTFEGSRLTFADTMTWDFLWTAPIPSDTVFFSMAANAANGDDSPFGDLIELISAHTVASVR